MRESFGQWKVSEHSWPWWLAPAYGVLCGVGWLGKYLLVFSLF